MKSSRYLGQTLAPMTTDVVDCLRNVSTMVSPYCSMVLMKRDAVEVANSSPCSSPSPSILRLQDSKMSWKRTASGSSKQRPARYTSIRVGSYVLCCRHGTVCSHLNALLQSTILRVHQAGEALMSDQHRC